MAGDARGAALRRDELVAAGAGLLYTLLTFLSGAVLQKFDLAVGALLLAATLALVDRQRAAGVVAAGGGDAHQGIPHLRRAGVRAL